MVGNIYQVPDKKWWGFEAEGRKDHPGACAGMATAHKVNLIKGTDPKSADYNLVQVVVAPDSSNNLLKTTSFGIKPFPKSVRKIQTELSEKLIGTLANDDLEKMQKALEKYFTDGAS